MTETTKNIDATRRLAGETGLALLNTHPFETLTLDEVATEARIDAGLLHRLFTDMSVLVDQGIRDMDDKIIFGLAEDFAEDPEASVREKILEGLIVRFEAYAPYKMAINHLNKASCRNPILGGMLILRLNHAMHSLLRLAGGAGDGLTGMLRVKGLSAVALTCQRDWMKDETSDLAATSRALDTRLKQAESLAVSFRLIPDDRERGDHGSSQF
ncbi:hypothetical protein AB8880_01880 [Alphaproteobacteria bacterium LSUCC0684]